LVFGIELFDPAESDQSQGFREDEQDDRVMGELGREARTIVRTTVLRNYIVFRSAADARDQLHREIPNLITADWSVKSPFNTEYQCIAWAACRTDRRWWPWDDPSLYWPPGFKKLPVGDPAPAAHFMEVFEKRFGYRSCGKPDFEFGYQKVAIYENALGVTHMARQHLLGRGWLSKLGIEEDIVHQLATDVEGDYSAAANTYGLVAQYMKRSWWAALVRTCLFRCMWASFRFWVYRAIVRWDLS
jgi:hypothetical protein